MPMKYALETHRAGSEAGAATCLLGTRAHSVPLHVKRNQIPRMHGARREGVTREFRGLWSETIQSHYEDGRGTLVFSGDTDQHRIKSGPQWRHNQGDRGTLQDV